MTKKTVTISDIIKEYSKKIDGLDLELLISHTLKKTREFILTHPETKISKNELSIITKGIKRRIKKEPLAYIIGSKEFYGINFEVNKKTLIPRPETEMLIEQALLEIQKDENEKNIIDIGTGSGNIIISIAKNIERDEQFFEKNFFFGIDKSNGALKMAKKNALKHGLENKIIFLCGSFLEPFFKKNNPDKNKKRSLIIIANLPYLSKEIFKKSPIDVKKFEPKSALYSKNYGLNHYIKLFKQINNYRKYNNDIAITILIEYSPEQKELLQKIIASEFSKAIIEFKKDLAGKWRTVLIKI